MSLALSRVVVTWHCPVCRAENEEDGDCRVCRTDPENPGINSHEDDEVAPPAALRRVLPTLIVLVLGGLLAAAAAPAGSRWTSAASRQGWSDEVRTRRHEELNLALAEVKALVAELAAAATSGAPLSSTWSARLSLTRQEWRIYGDTSQYPDLETQEAAVAVLLEDLASLHFQVGRGLSGDPLNVAFSTLQDQILEAEVDLAHGP